MKTISLINMKGGVGKTTLAVNIGDYLARRNNKKILLIDVDPQFNATQCTMSTEEYYEYIQNGGHTIIDIFRDQPYVSVNMTKGSSQIPPINLIDIKPYTLKDNYHLIPGNLDLYREEMSAGSGKENRLKRFLNQDFIKDKYDYVIIDTPPTPSVWMTSISVLN